jgi:hypothetical protein
VDVVVVVDDQDLPWRQDRRWITGGILFLQEVDDVVLGQGHEGGYTQTARRRPPAGRLCWKV